MLEHKKGQIGETITWTVATVIIVVTLVVALYVSSVVADSKEAIISVKETVSGNGLENDLILQKYVFTYVLTSSDVIYSTLKASEEEGMFYGDVDDYLSKLEGNLND